MPFCGRIIKAMFTVNALNTLLGAMLSQSPNFSYSQSSNFDNAQGYTSAVFPDSFSSSPWLSCPMSPVPLSLFSTKAFSPRMDETNPTLHQTRGKAQSAATAVSSGGNTGKAQRAASSLLLLTFTLEPLPDQPPEQAATVVTEGGAHVVVDSEAVRHVDVEALLLELSTATTISSRLPHPAGDGSAHHTPPTPHRAFSCFSSLKALPSACYSLHKAKTEPWVVQPSISQTELAASVQGFVSSAMFNYIITL